MTQVADWTRTTIDCDTLIARMRDPDDKEAWYPVEQRYGPPVQAFAKRLGLGLEDAQDARQEVMLAFAQAIRDNRFDRKRGRLRDFLFGIAKRRILTIRTRVARERRFAIQPDQSSFFRQLAGEDEWEKLWDKEWQLAVRAHCLKEAQEHFSPATYWAFHFKAVEELPSAETAERLGKTISAVDTATFRVREFLGEIHPAMEDIF